jgi:hypothetical protein
MYVLEHFDWFGPVEELAKIDKKYREMFDGRKGIEFLGRYAPHNKKYHWTYVYNAKDFVTFVTEYDKADFSWYKRDIKVHTHAVLEYYS